MEECTTTKQKIAEIIAVRDDMPVDCILDQLDQMIEEMRKAADHEMGYLWTDWTGLELDYFVGFVLENLQ